MQGSNLPEWAAVILGFISVIPMFLALGRTIVPEYSPFGMKCDRWLASRPPGPAVLAGILAGGLAAGVLLFAFHFGFGTAADENQVGVVKEPAKPLNWTIQIAFFYAGFLEESAKLILAAAFMFVFSLRRVESSRIRFIVLRSAPFLAAAAGLGFSLVENVRFLQHGGTAGVGALVVARALFGSTAHTVIDFHFGLSLLQGKELRAGVLVRAFLTAVLFHGVYDFFALPQGTFAHLLAAVFLVLISVWAVMRMHAILPETRHRPLRVREEAALPYMRGETHAPPGGVYFVRELLHDPHRMVHPPLAEPPFSPDEFPFGSDVLRRAILSPEYRGPVPLTEQGRWIRIERAVSLAVTGSPAEGRAWDTSIFADLIEEDPRVDDQLRRMGIDLMELQPIRIIEHEPGPGRPWYLYTTCGLAGVDFWITFPHPFPLIRLLFVHMAAAREGSILSLPNRLSWDPFEIVKLDGLLLGDPRGWFRGLMPVPVLDPAGRRYFEETEGDTNLPVELLYLSSPDVRWIEEHGVRSWFENLKGRGVPWFPDFRRPPPF